MKDNNVGKNIIQENRIEEGFYLLKFENTEDKVIHASREVDKSFLQLHFCVKNRAGLSFNGGHYVLDLPENKSYLLYNPQQDLPIHLDMDPGAKVISLLISIEKFHTFFTQEAGLIHFLSGENQGKKCYRDKELNPNEMMVLNQIFHFGLHSSLEKLYSRGKVYELVSLYFHKSDNDGIQNCPFLEDEANVEKIQKAKQIIIERMTEPPSLTELAHQINLPLQHLKDGFKQIYGETVFAYLLNYKMEYARKLLSTRKYNISEVSFEVGYSTPSHFIAAFKKKFGATPKRYMSSL
ncbi:helix-turn-helix transcriptional regulator [Lutimonas zeaxanthinifaciens]|uniref:helix-turn-helix transcriptional regulator n=1 Tax=Lutimonas zeaxanthinifaciens TaxID=3060215 RepID=UPI00265D1D09|nr:AraC family transcriptional regulator [Lutimonas sp. YSD2104]WKK65440.1 AraC family transcriptional regulator [Lutimonas sp. YSD2104]